MSTTYPIVLVHGVGLKEFKFLRAFGKIEKILSKEGYLVSTADTDGFGKIETNAEQLKEYIEKVLQENNTQKVNIIAHSKGGLDTRYMIDRLGMKDKVASATFLCTPHKGSQIATRLYALPNFVKKFIAFWLTLFYKICGDKKPEVLEVCKELQHSPDDILETFNPFDGIFMQSYSTVLQKGSDDFIMGIPLYFSRKYEKDESDGLVSIESSKFAEYRGNCINDSISHAEIVDFTVNKKKKEKIYAFYISLCADLAERGF